MIVIDIDPQHGASIQGLEAIAGPMPPTLTTITGRGTGGMHLLVPTASRRQAGR